MITFYFEYTDLFCGELNYGFLSRYAVKARTEKGAARILAKYIGIKYRYDVGREVYLSKSRLTAFYAVYCIDNNWLDIFDDFQNIN